MTAKVVQFPPPKCRHWRVVRLDDFLVCMGCGEDFDLPDDEWRDVYGEKVDAAFSEYRDEGGK